MSGVIRVDIKSVLVGARKNKYYYMGRQEQNPPARAFLRSDQKE